MSFLPIVFFGSVRLPVTWHERDRIPVQTALERQTVEFDLAGIFWAGVGVEKGFSAEVSGALPFPARTVELQITCSIRIAASFRACSDVLRPVPFQHATLIGVK